MAEHWIDDQYRGVWFTDNTIAYTLFSFMAFVINFLLVITLAKYGQLSMRKEYIVIFSLAMADCAGAAGYILSALIKVGVMINHDPDAGWPPSITRWECMYARGKWLFVYGHVISTVMLVSVSVDRLVAVGWPLKYFKWTWRQPTAICAAFATASFTISTIFVVNTFMMSDEWKNTYDQCVTTNALGPDKYYIMVQAYFAVRMGCASLSVVSYALLPILLYFNTRKTTKVEPSITARTAHSNSAEERKKKVDSFTAHVKRQRRMLTTLGTIIISTCTFYVIPHFIASFLCPSSGDCTNILLVFIDNHRDSIALINPILNPIIYMWRQTDIRRAYFRVITCGVYKRSGAWT